LAHGAQFVYTADDAYNPSVDPRHPGVIFPLPGPGMFAEMLKKLMFPHGRNNFCAGPQPLCIARAAAHTSRNDLSARANLPIGCAGKGGNQSTQYMFNRAVKQLIQQGHSGDRSTILMVGDRFDTDIRGGLAAGVRTCLVFSGCHSLEDGAHYPEVAHFTAKSISSLHPTEAPTEAPAADTPVQKPALQPQGSHLRRPRLPSLDLELGEIEARATPPRTPDARGESAEALQSWILARSNLLFTPHYAQNSTPPLRQCLEVALSRPSSDVSPAENDSSSSARDDGVDTESLGLGVPGTPLCRLMCAADVDVWSDKLVEWEQRVHARRQWRRTQSKIKLPSQLAFVRNAPARRLPIEDDSQVLEPQPLPRRVSTRTRSAPALRPSYFPDR